VPPSTLSLLGLVRHLAQVGSHWFHRVLQGKPMRLACASGTTPTDFNGAAADPGRMLVSRT
jgi:hypothetical protein